jgi:hypothetical protein
LRRAAEVLDFGQPAAVMPLGVLHLIRDSEDPRGIVARLMERGPDFLSALQGGDSRLSRRFPAWLGVGFLLRCAGTAPGLACAPRAVTASPAALATLLDDRDR